MNGSLFNIPFEDYDSRIKNLMYLVKTYEDSDKIVEIDIHDLIAVLLAKSKDSKNISEELTAITSYLTIFQTKTPIRVKGRELKRLVLYMMKYDITDELQEYFEALYICNEKERIVDNAIDYKRYKNEEELMYLYNYKDQIKTDLTYIYDNIINENININNYINNDNYNVSNIIDVSNHKSK